MVCSLLVLACALSLCIGFIAGREFGSGWHPTSPSLRVPKAQVPETQPATQLAAVVTPITTSRAGVTTPAVTAKAPETTAHVGAAQPYYATGTTVFSKPAAKQPVCLNTCPHANNGVCNDGRQLAGRESPVSRQVLCDLGTDCADCGPWTPSGHAPWVTDGVPGPIARLQQAAVEVRVRKTGMGLGFEFAFTDPTKDVDVSRHMEEGGVVESGITAVFHKIFSEKCDPANNGGKRGLFVDVGSNFGWFSVLAAVMGCRALAFEPVPHFHAFLEYNVHVNGVAHLVDMRGNVVSHVSGSTLKMVVPSQGIWGTAGIDGLNIDRAIQGSVNKEILIPSQKLDDLVKEDVLLLKVDVEGWEWSVVQGASKLFKSYDVENIIMEYSPGVPERNFRNHESKATVQMLINLVKGGYRLGHLGDATKHISGGLSSSLPPMEEVTAHNLLYDLVDMELFSRRVIGCPPTPEMMKFVMWASCGALPEDASPRSLRGLLGHNTNLWASKTTRLLKLQGVVGILPLSAPANQYFVDTGNKTLVFGMGSRLCSGLPPEVQVRHRCPCTNKNVCGAEENTANKVLSTTGFPSNYVLSADGRLLSGVGDVAKVMREIGSAHKIGELYLPGAVTGMFSS